MIKAIQKNIYVQFFLDLNGFQTQKIFDSSNVFEKVSLIY